MALSDLAVFSETAYLAVTEVIRQQVEKFNAASNGTIVLNSGTSHQGDYAEKAFWKKMSGLVRRRNPYGSGAVAAINLEHLTDTMVKIAAGTPPVAIDPGQFEWITRSPDEAGLVIGQQLAGDTMGDMLNVALMVSAAALSNDAEITYDYSGTGTFDFNVFNSAQAKFGDRYSDIAAWVMHSKVLFDLFGAALTNGEALFTFGSINVRQDGFGRTFVVTDSASLRVTSPAVYKTLGLVAGAVTIDRNSDFTANIDTRNGDENIQRTYQSEWSYSAGVKGYAWDKTHGGKAPNDTALALATNWDRYATSEKDLAGVLVLSQ